MARAMKSIMLCLVLGSLSLPLFASPAQVVLIRHGEKPDQGNDLSEVGYQRAKLLPNFFNTNAIVKEFGPPIAIYAMAPSEEDGSLRPIETVTPLAESLDPKLDIQKEYKKKDIEPLVSDILSNKSYEGHMVVICWEHHMIPKIVKQFGWKNAPQWDDNVFDRAWVLGFTDDQVSSFQNIPQNLLPGDSQ